MPSVNNQMIIPKYSTLPSKEDVQSMVSNHNLLAEVADKHICNIQSTIDNIASLFKLTEFFADKNILYSLNYLLKNLNKKDGADSSELYDSFLVLINDVKLNAITLHLEIAEHIDQLKGLKLYIEALPKSPILDLILEHTRNHKETLECLDCILVGETSPITNNAGNDGFHMYMPGISQ